jgi:putative ABC transport system permease protein
MGEFNNQMGGVIIGVCKDYHSEDFTKKILPAYFTVNKNQTPNIWVKLKAGQNIPAEIEKIKASWNKITGNLPFSYTLMDEEVAKSSDAFLHWMTTITSSCIIAIILACLGLFGLSGLTTINRTKEIGIRKVLGASVANLFLLVNREILFLAIGAFVLAVPVAVYFTHQWLENFAYRIHADWFLFVTAGVISVLAALVAVSYHTIKAAKANPADSLRSE